MKEIFHNFFVPIILGLVLTAVKLITDGVQPSFNESNNIGLDIILVSIGTFTIYMRGKDIDTVMAAGAGNALAATVLLILRYKRRAQAAKLQLAGLAQPETTWYYGLFQIGLGILAFVWTIKAF